MKYLISYPIFESRRIGWTLPNFRREWLEARRYPELRRLGLEGWLELASTGTPIDWASVSTTIGNTDLEFTKLNPDKKGRFLRDFAKGSIELPIAVEFPGGEVDLLGGNTRVAGLLGMAIQPKLWLIKI